MTRRYIPRPHPIRITADKRDPRSLLRVLDEPHIALATAIVLQAKDDLQTFPDARALFFAPWFGLFADALESEPQRLRAWLGVSDISAEIA